MRIGYARVSTQDQNLSLQLDALTGAGCKAIFQEKVSGKTKERPELIKCFQKLNSGDELVVWKLDRLGRSLKDLIELVDQLNGKGIIFISLQDSINTSTPTGRFTFNLFAFLAEFERDIIKERTAAGVAAARARGRSGERPKGLSKSALSKAKSAKVLYEKGEQTVEEIAKSMSISVATAYRYIAFITREEANKTAK